MDYDVSSYKKPFSTYFSPYAMNGGTVLALSGEDFAIIASDTRLSEGFMIHSRESPKTYSLTDKTVLGCVGFHGDALTVTKILEARLKVYEHNHRKEMTTPAIAALLSTILYHRRFFPYYVYNLIAGIDEEGKGCIYSFDPVGSYERETCRAAGSSSAMLQPLLDNQIECKNQQNVQKAPLTQARALQLVKDVFVSAAERDIYTGDCITVNLITKDGITNEEFKLRKD